MPPYSSWLQNCSTELLSNNLKLIVTVQDDYNTKTHKDAFSNMFFLKTTGNTEIITIHNINMYKYSMHVCAQDGFPSERVKFQVVR